MIVNPQNLAEVYGMAQVDLSTQKHSKARVAILIDAQYQKNGFCVAALQLLFDYIFNNLNIYKIYTEIMEQNEPSMVAAAKAGMKYECPLEKDVYYGGKFHDVKRYRVFKHEFNKSKKVSEKVAVVGA